MKKLLVALLVIPAMVSAQMPSRWENYQFRHFDRYVYASGDFHTSVRPFLMNQVDSIVSIDSLFTIETSKKLTGIILNRSWVRYKRNDIQFSIDPHINFEIARGDSSRTQVSSRGFIVSGNVGKNLAFTSTFQENQAVFNDYRAQSIAAVSTGLPSGQVYGVMPGEGNYKPFKTDGYDWATATGLVSYSPSKHFNLQLGNGKNSFGDGYRSLLLSDLAPAYPFFKITTDFWKIKYVNLWAQFTDLRTPRLLDNRNNAKWGSMHYLSWNVFRWANISLFEAVVWENASEAGHRGFDIHYANPVIFYRPVEAQNGSPDNMLVGASAKITILKRHVLYGQLMLDEFNLSHVKARDGWWANKYGMQAGAKVFDLFGISHLDIQGEFNWVRPFTYSHWSSLQCYGHYNQPLAHPLGANFKEIVGIGRYHFKRFFIHAKVIMASYGSNLPTQNVGQDIFLPYNIGRKELGNTLGQGIANTITQADLSLSWLINPVSNLNVALGLTNRKMDVAGTSNTNQLVYVALRTSLANIGIDY